MARDERKEERYERRKEESSSRRRVSEDERLEGRQPMGRKEKGVFGREFAMGIAEWDIEAEKAGLVPLKNKFSWMESSQEEAMRVVKGRGTSYQSERMRDTD